MRIVKDVLGEQYPQGGNFLRPGLKPAFTDVDVIVLSMTAETLGIDSENKLFSILKFEYTQEFPNLISRRQYNDRRKSLFPIQAEIRQKMADSINEGNEIYAVDSMPLEVCKMARMERNKMGKQSEYSKPEKGYCASQDKWYFGYKAHCVCSSSGVIQLFDLTSAKIHDVNFLKDVKYQIENCTLVGDRGYISKAYKHELWEHSRINIEVPYKANQIEKVPMTYNLRVIRKRVETIFSQLCDMFMIQRNYAKSFYGYRTRILAKISGFTILQFINKYVTHRPLSHVKYALNYKQE